MQGEVLVNTGGPDFRGIVVDATPWNDMMKDCILVQFGTTASWIPRSFVRPMQLTDHRRVHGLRFDEWQRSVWYTLSYRCHHGFDGFTAGDLAAFWSEGWSVAAMVRHLATVHTWRIVAAPRTLPLYAQQLVADMDEMAQEA